MNIQLNKKKLTLIGQRVRIVAPQHWFHNTVGTVTDMTSYGVCAIKLNYYSSYQIHVHCDHLEIWEK